MRAAGRLPPDLDDPALAAADLEPAARVELPARVEPDRAPPPDPALPCPAVDPERGAARVPERESARVEAEVLPAIPNTLSA